MKKTKNYSELLSPYKEAPLRYKFYTIIRCFVCPFGEIEKYVPDFGKILDCGCGHGIFANFLSVKSGNRHVIGLDINADRIKIAASTIKTRKNIEFIAGDIGKYLEISDIKCITFIDVLHYVPFDEKKALLARIFNKLHPNGTLIIKSIYELPYWKYWLTLFHVAVIDKLIHKGFRGSAYFLRKENYLDLLTGLGFKVKFKCMGKGFPYPHCLYICTKVKDAVQTLQQANA